MNEPRYKGIPLSELFDPPRISKQQTNFVLAGSLNEKGIKHWWTRPRHQLDGLTPEKAWKQGKKREVYNLALSSLESGGT